jgi:outer membrane protein X
MKKLLMIAFMALMSTTMFAQAGSTWVGANVNYGLHSDYKNLGFGAKVQWEFIDNVRAEASGNYFLKKDYCTMWDLNLNLHYLVSVDKLKIYPLAGLTILDSKVEVGNISASDSNFGINLGAGVEYPISETVKLNLEGKYQIVKDWNRPVISAGIAFAL